MIYLALAKGRSEGFSRIRTDTGFATVLHVSKIGVTALKVLVSAFSTPSAGDQSIERSSKVSVAPCSSVLKEAR